MAKMKVNKTAQKIGVNIRDLRIERGMRQVDLADALNLHPSRVCWMEKGYICVPSKSAIKNVAAALGVDTSALYKGVALEELI
jgi:transcriptional regulator with XRE-family HTH domain